MGALCYCGPTAPPFRISRTVFDCAERCHTGHGVLILYILRTIHDGNNFAHGTNRLTDPHTLGNVIEVALRRIPIAPDLNPNENAPDSVKSWGAPPNSPSPEKLYLRLRDCTL
jgi:hypothetical protein